MNTMKCCFYREKLFWVRITVSKWYITSWPYLERAEEELEKENDVTEDALRALLCQHRKDHFVDPQQRDQGQGGFGESGEIAHNRRSFFLPIYAEQDHVRTL